MPSQAAIWLDLWERAGAAPAAVRADSLLAACLSAGTPGSLALGTRDALLLDLRASLFGPQLSSTATCPACSERCEWDCEVQSLRAAPPAVAPEAIEILEDGWCIRARAICSADLAAAAACEDEDAALRTLLRRCVRESSHEGREVDAAQLPGQWIERLSASLAAADPQAAFSLRLSCPACAHTWNAAFDIGAYLFTELDVWAQRTLGEVDELACRYGWSEPEILALTPARRARYLALAAT